MKLVFNSHSLFWTVRKLATLYRVPFGSLVSLRGVLISDILEVTSWPFLNHLISWFLGEKPSAKQEKIVFFSDSSKETNTLTVGNWKSSPGKEKHTHKNIYAEAKNYICRSRGKQQFHRSTFSLSRLSWFCSVDTSVLGNSLQQKTRNSFHTNFCIYTESEANSLISPESTCIFHICIWLRLGR